MPRDPLRQAEDAARAWLTAWTALAQLPWAQWHALQRQFFNGTEARLAPPPPAPPDPARGTYLRLLTPDEAALLLAASPSKAAH